MPILIATSNAHKLDEIRAIWTAEGDADARVELIGLAALGRSIAPPVEDQLTFEANAALKARCYAAAAGMACLADDSGLVVDALGGRPGVHSARFAGAGGARAVVDAANNQRLLEELGDTPEAQRTAHFVCAMCLCGPGPDAPPPILAAVQGAVEGRILTREEAGPDGRGRGHHGFGYDPLFLVGTMGRTAAQLAPHEKNRISHRGQAARLMWKAVLALTRSEGASLFTGRSS